VPLGGSLLIYSKLPFQDACFDGGSRSSDFGVGRAVSYYGDDRVLLRQALLCLESDAVIFREEARSRLPGDNNDWSSLWLGDQIWSQTSHELWRRGFDQQWPAWAGHMIQSSRREGHVDITAPRAAQMAALLANENRRFLNSRNRETTLALLDHENRMERFAFSVPRFSVTLTAIVGWRKPWRT